MSKNGYIEFKNEITSALLELEQDGRVDIIAGNGNKEKSISDVASFIVGYILGSEYRELRR